MGNPKGFLKIKRGKTNYRPVAERLKDYDLVFNLRLKRETRDQAARCMDCGTPFCHWACPIGNYIPEWNDLVYSENWEKAFDLLNATNCLPEVTGRVCPALCEAGCVLGINDDPVTIRENELAIVERAFKTGYLKPHIPKKRTGKKVAIVGSGPAGLSCAVELNRLGHYVTLFEKADKLGGIMRYGIPDFKLEKTILDRRIDIWKKEGIEFKTGINVGENIPADKLLADYAAVCLAGGSRVPRDLKVPGRELNGIVFAMDYLTQSNRRVAEPLRLGETIPADQIIDAKGKKVVVIGGGDTGSDCVGTANRQGAKCVVQIEVMPKPQECRTPSCPWPQYPILLKTTSSHEEGCERHWSIITKQFTGSGSRITKLLCAKADSKLQEIPGTDFEVEADLVILAVGFVHPEKKGLLQNIGVDFDQRGNVKTDNNFQTSIKKVFAAGDMHRGQSLIVWAIWEGQQAAEKIHQFLDCPKPR
ncbi:MAG: glutamate synthase subunit beta [Candidatus Margulisiibacteriota bacterium]